MTPSEARAREHPAPSPLAAQWTRGLGHLLAYGIWNTRVTGAEHVPATGPVLYAANHLNVVDGPLLASVSPRPAHLLVKAEMFTGPIGLFLTCAGQIAVDRHNGRDALLRALAVLRRGGVVGVFPEGSRGRGDAASARGGVAWLALTGSAPVVPVALLGSRRTGEHIGHIPGPRRPLVVEFGPPMAFGHTPGVPGRVAVVAANEAIRAALSALVASASARTGVALPADDPNDPGSGSE